MSSKPSTFLPYHEPGIVTILTQTSFLLFLNIINTLFDKLIFCGLLGQVLIGVLYGTPGAQWLGLDVEDVIVQLGYLGLILLVYEGGLSTNFSSLKANLFLSIGVAITGISFPIALSFTLLPLVGATPVQAFAAGAALCSTSLGTIFTILSTSGLTSTRLGTVLTTAAMLDDVVGLVMVQVISNLGSSMGRFSAVTVVRPLAVSVGFTVLTPLWCRYVVVPVTRWLNAARKSNPKGRLDRVCNGEYTAFVLHTLVLLAFVTGSTYAGTSNLFAAYLAGACISWWDSEVEHPETLTAVVLSSDEEPSPNVDTGAITEPSQPRVVESSGHAVFHRYYAQAVQRILKPFFFASIGFAIPITEMFSGGIIWRGIVFTVLMLFAKGVTGLWLVRLELPRSRIYIPKALRSLSLETCWRLKMKSEASKDKGTLESHEMKGRTKPDTDGSTTPQKSTIKNNNPPQIGDSASSRRNSGSCFTTLASPRLISQPPQTSPETINKPLSLYPAAMLGTAMTARGEIGFLIASIAETTGVFAPADADQSSSKSSEIYLVATWAIVLCTITGPLSMGMLVKRVRRLQANRERNPLGIWGVN